MLKFIIIDSEKKEIREVQHKEGSDTLKIMQDAVDGYIDLGMRMEGNDLFVNDEGLLNGPEHFFFYEGAHQPFAGNGIISGTNEDGETVSTTITVEEVKKKVKFLSREEIIKMYR